MAVVRADRIGCLRSCLWLILYSIRLEEDMELHSAAATVWLLGAGDWANAEGGDLTVVVVVVVGLGPSF